MSHGFSVLVVGGAGYIGSHMMCCPARSWRDGHYLRQSFHRTPRRGARGRFPSGKSRRPRGSGRLFSTRRFDAVPHFASFIAGGRIGAGAARYYTNNAVNTRNLLDARVGVENFLFSSSAAGYGNPRMVEDLLAEYGAAYGLRSVSLRYFNAAGARPACRLGERHEPLTHPIPLVLPAASGRLAHVSVFGRDYDTADGTCIRDYVHVTDLADAHGRAVTYLFEGGATTAFNLGNGMGFSVAEAIATAERVTQRRIPVVDAPHRAGDPARLVADARRAQTMLGWQPRYTDFATLIAHAWAWECRAG